MPYDGTSMPLGSVTSVKRSVRVPSAPTDEIVAEQPIPERPCGLDTSRPSASSLAPSICPCTR